MIFWPLARAGEALEALARRSGLEPKSGGIPAPHLAADDPKAAGQWIEGAALCLGLEAEPQEIRYQNAQRSIQSAAPALLWCSGGGLLALADADTIIAPDLSVKRLGRKALRAELCRAAEDPLLEDLNALLEASGIPRRRRQRVREELLGKRLAPVRVGYCWTLRLPPGADFRLLLKRAGCGRWLAALGVAHVANYTLWLLGWWILGLGSLQGRLDPGWLVAWGLLLATLVPIRGAIAWLQGRVATVASGILKERLLAGALRMEPQEIRLEGAGQLLGRVIESQALESLAVAGGFVALVSVIELAVSAVVLALGTGGAWHVLLLALWGGFAMLLARRYFQEQTLWTDSRLWMTHDLVERMVGHRTRLAQEPREHWHRAEDEALDRYQAVSRRADRSAARLLALVPRGWLILGIAGLAPAFLSGRTSPQFAVAMGGVLLAYGAFKRLASGLWNLVGAKIAWKQVAPLFHAAARTATAGRAALASVAAPSQGELVMEAHDISFRYRDRGEMVLRRSNLTIREGDRVMLEGPSGGGKSTLASLLCGTLRPESGLLLARGLDRHALGAAGWLRRVSAAPQFHENHVLTGTFAFNLLMGRPGWVEERDFAEAETICRELGLGPLLEKMPAGMLQMVGESGWQLSHGERSRLYIARALLQGADLLIFDESFAALDPENLRLAVDCMLRRARTVLVIAHP